MPDTNGDTVFHHIAKKIDLETCSLLTGQEHRAIKAFLLVHARYKKKGLRFPKPLWKIIGDFAFPYTGIYTDKYIYHLLKSIKYALEKNNNRSFTAHALLCSQQKTAIQKLEKVEPFLDRIRKITEIKEQIIKIAKMQHMLDPHNYAR